MSESKQAPDAPANLFTPEAAACPHAAYRELATTYAERQREMPVFLRPTIAIGMLVIGALSAQVGLTDLIARGYGTVTWAFIGVFVVPVLTLGVWKIARAPRG